MPTEMYRKSTDLVAVRHALVPRRRSEWARRHVHLRRTRLITTRCVVRCCCAGRAIRGTRSGAGIERRLTLVLCLVLLDDLADLDHLCHAAGRNLEGPSAEVPRGLARYFGRLNIGMRTTRRDLR
jgi:hypothetical protein